MSKLGDTAEEELEQVGLAAQHRESTSVSGCLAQVDTSYRCSTLWLVHCSEGPWCCDMLVILEPLGTMTPPGLGMGGYWGQCICWLSRDPTLVWYWGVLHWDWRSATSDRRSPMYSCWEAGLCRGQRDGPPHPSVFSPIPTAALDTETGVISHVCTQDFALSIVRLPAASLLGIHFVQVF